MTFSCGPTLTSQVQSWIALVALSIRSPCFLTSANAAFVLRPHVALVGFALWVLTKFGGPGPHQSHPKRTIRSNSFLAFSCGESEASHLSWSTIILWSYYCLYMLIYTHSWGMLRHDLVRHPSSPSTRDDPGWPGPGLAWNPDCRRGIAAPPCASPRVGTSNIHCPVQDCLENGWKWTLKASRPGFFYGLYTRVGTKVWISLLKYSDEFIWPVLACFWITTNIQTKEHEWTWLFFTMHN